MLFFGHLGVTAGVVRVVQALAVRTPSPAAASPQKPNSWSRFQSKFAALDYRFLLLGSLLPDIIDKPVWYFTGPNFPWDGRGYAHSFLFSLTLLIAGFVVNARAHRTWLLVVSTGSFFHLLEDQMWRFNPTALWWPFLGSVTHSESEGFLGHLEHNLVADPYTGIAELVGLAIILVLVWQLWRRHRLLYFLKTGRLL